MPVGTFLLSFGKKHCRAKNGLVQENKPPIGKKALIVCDY